MTHKDLNKYTNEELFEVLKDNESIILTELAGYCSEILRRILIEKTIIIKE